MSIRPRIRVLRLLHAAVICRFYDDPALAVRAAAFGRQAGRRSRFRLRSHADLRIPLRFLRRAIRGARLGIRGVCPALPGLRRDRREAPVLDVRDRVDAAQCLLAQPSEQARHGRSCGPFQRLDPEGGTEGGEEEQGLETRRAVPPDGPAGRRAVPRGRQRDASAASTSRSGSTSAYLWPMSKSAERCGVRARSDTASTGTIMR